MYYYIVQEMTHFDLSGIKRRLLIFRLCHDRTIYLTAIDYHQSTNELARVSVIRGIYERIGELDFKDPGAKTTSVVIRAIRRGRDKCAEYCFVAYLNAHNALFLGLLVCRHFQTYAFQNAFVQAVTFS